MGDDDILGTFGVTLLTSFDAPVAVVDVFDAEGVEGLLRWRGAKSLENDGRRLCVGSKITFNKQTIAFLKYLLFQVFAVA